MIKALSVTLVMAAVCLCCFAAETVPVWLERDPVEIVGGYSVGRTPFCGLELYAPPWDPKDGMGLKYPTVVDQEVVRIGWDQDFILVEQHPFECTIGARPDSSRPRWHIVVVSTGKVYSDLTYERFATLKETLAIPTNIEMRSARKIYGH